MPLAPPTPPLAPPTPPLAPPTPPLRPRPRRPAAEASGTIVKALVENGDAVLPGQPLFIIKP